MSLSGIPYTGVDIGGFSGTPTRNLFIRWFQLGAFLPLFRVHSAKGAGDRELWSYGEEVLDILRRFIELRYSLIPYWYSVAFDSHQTGHPLIRPISYHYPQTLDGYSFMVGESILVYPVLDENVRKMRIKLPPGKWYSLWDSSVKKGTVEEDLDESRIPVYVREGSVIPREDGKLHFDVYPGGNFSFTYYMDDDGLVPVFRTIRFTGRSDGDTFSLEYEHGGDLKDNEKVILILKDKDCVFKENNSQEISVTQRKGKVEVAHKS
jgi:alpha-glucosidase